MKNSAVLAAGAILLCGCAKLQFQSAPSDDALTYYETTPYFLIQQDLACVQTAQVVSSPGRKRGVKLNSGYGSANLSVSLSADGTIASVNQETDTKFPETITAVTGLAKIIAPPVVAAGKCEARAALFPIVDGHVDLSRPVKLRLD